ncbi:MAG TPA: hypothetical protein PKE39_10670 [Ignavibacteria bacterium]|nr:hypothetical protein [Ignavibacteria bacterium]HMQ99476.1 hypothetical protein [Ignavibacteria bacterium]
MDVKINCLIENIKGKNNNGLRVIIVSEGDIQKRITTNYTNLFWNCRRVLTEDSAKTEYVVSQTGVWETGLIRIARIDFDVSAESLTGDSAETLESLTGGSAETEYVVPKLEFGKQG